MQNKLLIIDINTNIKRANNHINKINLKDYELFYLSDTIVNDSKKYLTLDDLFKSKDASMLYKEVRRFAREWYKPIENEFKYFNLSLLNLVETELIKLWPLFLKIDKLSSFIRKQSSVHLITEYDEDIEIIKEVCKIKRIEFSYKKFKIIKKKSFKTWLKDYAYIFIANFQNFLFKINSKKRINKRNILFIGNLRQTSLLLKELKKDKKNIVIRIGENVGSSFNSYTDYYVSYKYFLKRDLNKKLDTVKKELRIKWNDIKKNQKFKKSLYYKKIPLFNPLKKWMYDTITNRFFQLIRYIEITKSIANEFDILVTHNDILSFDRTIVKTADKLGKPTVTMIEGFFPGKQILKDNVYLPFSSKIMTLHSKSQKNVIKEKYKINDNKLVITGYPLFDQYYNQKPFPKEELCKTYNIPFDKKIVLYTAERYMKNKYENSLGGALTKKQYLSALNELFRAVKDIRNVFLIIKKHPSGSQIDDDVIQGVAKKFKVQDFLITKSLDIYNLLSISDVIITRRSTMGIEAMFLGKFVVIFDTYFDTADEFGYTDFNAAIRVSKPGDLNRALDGLLYNKDLMNKTKLNIKRFIKYHYSVNDGNSSFRMASLINKLKKL